MQKYFFRILHFIEAQYSNIVHTKHYPISLRRVENEANDEATKGCKTRATVESDFVALEQQKITILIKMNSTHTLHHPRF